MRRSFLIFLFLFAGSLTLGQSPPKKTRRPKPEPSRKIESPCGVSQTIEEFIEEIRLDWRVAAETDDKSWLYNTKILCDNKILKIWVKVVPKDKAAPYPYSMLRYELNCRTDQYRLMSATEYSQGGKALGTSRGERNPDWEDAVPDSVMEGVLRTVCNKP